ncbi:N-acetylmuramoyl-L-alanine amidase [Halorussus lipolyticus]|uniref:peptidoglycan recognition protein family protein n=1 Tax=Halorussus lipolyticus TaxID=3034024 RepID=UPI0023E8E3CE|nr:N-acetylmuramoyl-L-alanine amidase [Halorussus sp. DT80]
MTERNTRRSFLKAIGATATVGALADTAAAYHTQDPYVDDFRPADSSNYTSASRGAEAIDWVVIHVGEGDYGGMVGWFQDPSADVSAHYAIRNSDGYASQMVHHEDKAWHAGGQNYNYYSIGIEHGGYTDQTQFTDALYKKSANIVSSLCDQYNIPKNHPSGVAPCDASTDGGIIGHHQVPESDCGPNNHTDPGSTWDWDYYMDLVGGTNNGGGGDGGTSYSWPTYSYGDQAEAVYSIQYLLEENGYPLDYHDGIYGTEVETTIEQFQSDRNITVDGIVGPETWNELYVVVWDAEDDPWWATYGAQHHLNYGQGYDIAVDGYYGPETRSAIEDFQTSAGLTVDGVVGHDTWQALMDI